MTFVWKIGEIERNVTKGQSQHVCDTILLLMKVSHLSSKWRLIVMKRE